MFTDSKISNKISNNIHPSNIQQIKSDQFLNFRNLLNGKPF